MGLHSGIASASEVTFNPTTSAYAYSGPALLLAKACGDSAAGGMVSQPVSNGPSPQYMCV